MARNLALPWYHRQDWTRLYQLFAERDCLPPHYDTWKQRALRAERRYRKKGYQVVRVPIAPQDLLVWCSNSGRAITLNARHEFAWERMAETPNTAQADGGR